MAAGIYSRTAAVLARTTQKGPGGYCVRGFLCSLFFSFGIMGQGALILSGIFDLPSLAPVKGTEVSRAIMTLETKGALLILCSSLEIHYMHSILECLPMETAEVRLVVPAGVTRFIPMSSEGLEVLKATKNPLILKQLHFLNYLISIIWL